MAKPSHIVVVSSDPAVASQVQQSDQNGSVSVVENMEAVQEEAKERTIDGLVLGDEKLLAELGSLKIMTNLSKTVVLAGPFPVADTANKLGWLLRDGQSNKKGRRFEDLTLEDYVESKFSEFVRAMKVSSARGLHSTLIRAVERPLIEMALRETNGNQIQAAHLLGMNRNTLRKKISELKIPLRRRPRSSRRVESVDN